MKICECVALLHISVAHIFYILHLLSVLFPLLCLFQRSQHTKTTKQKMQTTNWLDRLIHSHQPISVSFTQYLEHVTLRTVLEILHVVDGH